MSAQEDHAVSEQIGIALMADLGVTLTVDVIRPWATITFFGWTIAYSCGEDLPPDTERIQPELDGVIVADIRQLSARRLEVVAVKVPAAAE